MNIALNIIWTGQPAYPFFSAHFLYLLLLANTPPAADIVSDSVLLLSPAFLFRTIRDPWLRHRLIAIFSTCIVTTVISLVHASYILTAGGTRVVIAALVEVQSHVPVDAHTLCSFCEQDSVSLIVCNLPIVVSAAIHLGERYTIRKVAQSLESLSFRQLHVNANYATTQTLTDQMASSVIVEPRLPCVH